MAGKGKKRAKPDKNKIDDDPSIPDDSTNQNKKKIRVNDDIPEKVENQQNQKIAFKEDLYQQPQPIEKTKLTIDDFEFDSEAERELEIIYQKQQQKQLDIEVQQTANDVSKTPIEQPEAICDKEELEIQEKKDKKPVTAKPKNNKKQPKKKSATKKVEIFSDSDKISDADSDIEEKVAKPKPKTKNQKPKNADKTKPAPAQKTKAPNDKTKAAPTVESLQEDMGEPSELNKGLKGNKQLVAEYMLKQNRPYSLINIMDNQRGAIKKKDQETALNDLVKGKYLTEKEFGKTKIYSYNQDKLPVPDENELVSKIEENNQKKEELDSMINNQKKFKVEICGLKASPTDEELALEIQVNKKRLEEQDTWLQINDVDKEDSEEADKSNKQLLIDIEKGEVDCVKISKECLKRKKLFKEILGTLSEAMEMKTNTLQSEAGVELSYE